MYIEDGGREPVCRSLLPALLPSTTAITALQYPSIMAASSILLLGQAGPLVNSYSYHCPGKETDRETSLGSIDEIDLFRFEDQVRIFYQL